MTTYTAEEFDMISNAVLDASVALNIAHDNLYLMFSDYFECANSIEELRHVVAVNPRMIESRILAVMKALEDAKYELDLFMNPDSPLFKARMAGYEEKKNIIAAYKKDAERRERERQVMN